MKFVRIVCLATLALGGCASKSPPAPEPAAAMPGILIDASPIRLISGAEARTPRQRAVEGAAPILSACLAFLPFCPLVVAGVAVTDGWGAPQGAGEAAAARLAPVFRERATAAALGERVTGLASSAAFSGLALRMDSAVLSQDSQGITISLSARAHTFALRAERPPTLHRYQLAARPLAEWTADHEQLLRRGIDEALDGLAQSVVSTYVPGPRQPAMH